MVKFFGPLFLACLVLSFLSACSTNTPLMPTVTPVSTPSEYPILPDGLPSLKTITVSNAKDLQLVKILQIPGFARSRISQCSVAFSPDGKLLSGVCYKNTVPLWDVQSGQLLYSLQEKPSHEVAVAFSPDGTALAVGGFSGEIRIYDPATGKLTRTFEALPSAIWDLDFDPAGNKLASIGIEVGMQFLDFQTGKQLWEYVKEKGSAYFLSVDIDPAGKTIAFGKVPGDVNIVEAKTGQVINTLPIPANVGDLAFSPDGRLLATGSDDNQARLWKTSNYQLLKTFKGHTHYVNGVAFSPDGSLLVTGSHDKTVGIWDIQSGQRLNVLAGHEDVVLRVAVNPTGTLIASISWDGTVRLWGVVQGG